MRPGFHDLRPRLLAGEAVVTAWCMLPCTAAAELMAAQSYDAITVDLQHGLIDYQAALAMLQGIGRFDIATLCRIPWNEPGITGKLLDCGFGGVICPMVETADDARMLVRACRYGPAGSRSYGPTRARRLHGSDYATRANDSILVLAMIETAKGLANLDAILSVNGVDGVYIGPADLALSLGHAPTLDSAVPEVVAAIEHIRSRARDAGKVAGIHCGDGPSTRRSLESGFNFVALGTDVSILERASASQLGAARNTQSGGQTGIY